MHSSLVYFRSVCLYHHVQEQNNVSTASKIACKILNVIQEDLKSERGHLSIDFTNLVLVLQSVRSIEVISNKRSKLGSHNNFTDFFSECSILYIYVLVYDQKYTHTYIILNS